jgi:hypothetical protein
MVLALLAALVLEVTEDLLTMLITYVCRIYLLIAAF